MKTLGSKSGRLILALAVTRVNTRYLLLMLACSTRALALTDLIEHTNMASGTV